MTFLVFLLASLAASTLLLFSSTSLSLLEVHEGLALRPSLTLTLHFFSRMSNLHTWPQLLVFPSTNYLYSYISWKEVYLLTQWLF